MSGTENMSMLEPVPEGITNRGEDRDHTDAEQRR